jgi:hypothetical protein
LKNFNGNFIFIFIGISDGAGGNLMYGHDPRLFSSSLMRNCSDLAHTGKYLTSEPKRLLCHAFDCVQNENCFGMIRFFSHLFFVS